jgi:hypothetical protein
MTKLDVINRIRALASARGGHVSFDAFLRETGIKDKWLRGQEWYSGWNSLLSEVGLETRAFSRARTPLDTVAESVASLTERLGKWPTEDDIRRARARDRSFPSVQVVGRFRRSGALARAVVELAEGSGRFLSAAAIAKPHLVAEPDPEAASSKERVKGYVYMYRSGRRYKVGKTSDPSRRFREVGLVLPDETHFVHSIPTDDPTGIEAYWHERFSSKRVRNTEFFELDSSDVQAFKRRKYQ